MILEPLLESKVLKGRVKVLHRKNPAHSFSDDFFEITLKKYLCFFLGDSDSEVDSDDSDIEEVDKKRAASPELPEVRKPAANFFETTLSKMVSDLGMNLVQEAVQQVSQFKISPLGGSCLKVSRHFFQSQLHK